MITRAAVMTACFILHALYITVHHNVLSKKTRNKKLTFELNSIICGAAKLFKFPILYHGSYNGEKVRYLTKYNFGMNISQIHLRLYSK